MVTKVQTNLGNDDVIINFNADLTATPVNATHEAWAFAFISTSTHPVCCLSNLVSLS